MKRLKEKIIDQFNVIISNTETNNDEELTDLLIRIRNNIEQDIDAHKFFEVWELDRAIEDKRKQIGLFEMPLTPEAKEAVKFEMDVHDVGAWDAINRIVLKLDKLHLSVSNKDTYIKQLEAEIAAKTQALNYLSSLSIVRP